jgi:hypothetical protein
MQLRRFHGTLPEPSTSFKNNQKKNIFQNVCDTSSFLRGQQAQPARRFAARPRLPPINSFCFLFFPKVGVSPCTKPVMRTQFFID